MADCPECELCCAIGVCCAPGSSEQADAMRRLVARKHPGVSESDGAAMAQSILDAHNSFKAIRAMFDSAGVTDGPAS